MLHEQYLMLYDKLADGVGEGTSMAVTLDQIAETLFCTSRNAKLVLRKLEEKEWISWKAGRGRGHRSMLAFQTNQEHLLQEAAQQMAEKGEYKQAFELLRKYGHNIRTNDSFVEWMNGHFGFYMEKKEGEQDKDSFRLPIYHTIDSLDPGDCVYSSQAHMIEQIFDRLVTYDNKTGQYIPAISHHWESNDKGTVWTFHLRKGILFHNGNELTAEDVKYTFERLQGKRNRWIVRELKEVEVVNPRIVRFILNKPNRIFVRFLCAVCMSIVPSNLAGHKEESFWALPFGTGPFLVNEWSNERLILHANSHYYQGRPHVDIVNIVIMPENAIHFKVRNNDEVKIESLDSGCTNMLTWNMRKSGPYQSILFRRAVDLIIHRQAMIHELGEPRLFPARSFIRNEKSLNYSEQYDPELAKSLLEQAGYDGTPIVLGTIAYHAKDAAWIQKQCASIGIPVVIREERMDTILKPELIGKMDCMIHGLVLPGGEVCLIENYEHGNSISRLLMDPDLGEWIKESIDSALARTDCKERLGILNRIEDRLREEGHILFLAHRRFFAHSDGSYKGVVINALGWIDFKSIWRVQ